MMWELSHFQPGDVFLNSHLPNESTSECPTPAKAASRRKAVREVSVHRSRDLTTSPLGFADSGGCVDSCGANQVAQECRVHNPSNSSLPERQVEQLEPQDGAEHSANHCGRATLKSSNLMETFFVVFKMIRRRSQPQIPKHRWLLHEARRANTQLPSESSMQLSE